MVRRGSHMVPGCLQPEWLTDRASPPVDAVGVDPGPLDAPPALDAAARYCSLVLVAMYRAALAAAIRGGAQLCHYRELPGLVTRRLAPLFGVVPGPLETATLANVALRDSRNPLLPFTGPREAERRAAPAIQEVAEQLAGPLYSSLEAQRAAQLGHSLASGPVARP
jgi:hypothetical protein